MSRLDQAEPRRFERYVAIGDSSTEGLDDPDGKGGYRGWADRLAGHIAAAQGSVLYANLGVRGRHTRQVLEEQLDLALSMRPDVATVFAGSNDAVSRGFDADAVGRDIEHMQRRLIEAGATVVTFTLPDLTGVIPLGRFAAPRVLRFNDALRRASAATGATLVDFAAYPMSSDPRIWSEDGFHANSLGHERIAAALAHALAVPGVDDSWASPFPPARPGNRFRGWMSDSAWLFGHFLPWLFRHARGRSSGDGRGPKRPDLTEIRSSSS